MRVIVTGVSARMDKKGKWWGKVNLIEDRYSPLGGDPVGRRVRENIDCVPGDLAHDAKTFFEAHGEFYADVDLNDVKFGNSPTQFQCVRLEPEDTAAEFRFCMPGGVQAEKKKAEPVRPVGEPRKPVGEPAGGSPVAAGR